MSPKKRRPLELRLLVFILVAASVVFLNVRNTPEIVAKGNFILLAPHYGRALQNYLAAERSRDASERNWYAYDLVERHFRGWTLISFDREAGFFSGMYAFSFGGLKSTKVASYDPDLSAAEANGLLARRHWQGKIKRYGSLVIVPPEPDLSPGRVFMVRNGKSVFVAPEAYLPTRMKVPQ